MELPLALANLEFGVSEKRTVREIESNTKGGLISESFVASAQVRVPNHSPEHYPPKEVTLGCDLAPISGDLN